MTHPKLTFNVCCCERMWLWNKSMAYFCWSLLWNLIICWLKFGNLIISWLDVWCGGHRIGSRQSLHFSFAGINRRGAQSRVPIWGQFQVSGRLMEKGNAELPLIDKKLAETFPLQNNGNSAKSFSALQLLVRKPMQLIRNSNKNLVKHNHTIQFVQKGHQARMISIFELKWDKIRRVMTSQHVRWAQPFLFKSNFNLSAVIESLDRDWSCRKSDGKSWPVPFSLWWHKSVHQNYYDKVMITTIKHSNWVKRWKIKLALQWLSLGLQCQTKHD